MPWVIFRLRRAQLRGPLYLNEQTSSGHVGRSEKCQTRKFDCQGADAPLSNPLAASGYIYGNRRVDGLLFRFALNSTNKKVAGYRI